MPMLSESTSWSTVLHPWVLQKGLNPMVVERAKGNYFYDASGKQYLDFSSQFVFSNLGHGDERMVKAIANQVCQTGDNGIILCHGI